MSARAGSGPVGVGFIGTGMISDTYLDNLTRFPDVRVVILGDLDQNRARARAVQHGVPEWGTADDVLAGIDLTGRSAVVTGAASGIGVETARALARAARDAIAVSLYGGDPRASL